MKIELVYSYAMATKALFQANYAALVQFDNQFANPYLSNVFEPKIIAAKHLIGTLGKRNQNKEDTKIRNQMMDNIQPLLINLEYNIKNCISDGTITCSLQTFQLAAFRKSIYKRSIHSFHLASRQTIAKVIENQAALTAKGFTVEKTQMIKDYSNSAYAIQTEKIELKGEISNLSIANQIIINACLDECQKIINALQAMTRSTSNKELQRRATSKAILRSVVPTPSKKPRKRTIKPGSTIILTSRLAAKNILLLTLQTNVTVTLCRSPLKSQPGPTDLHLPYNMTWEGKKADIPGTGPYIMLTNHDLSQKAIVSVFQVIVTF